MLALPPNVLPPKALLLGGAVIVAAAALFTVRSGVFSQGSSETQARPATQARPQAATVVLNIAPAGTDLGAFLQTTGLIFVGRVGGANPAAKATADSCRTVETFCSWLQVYLFFVVCP